MSDTVIGVVHMALGSRPLDKPLGVGRSWALLDHPGRAGARIDVHRALRRCRGTERFAGQDNYVEYKWRMMALCRSAITRTPHFR